MLKKQPFLNDSDAGVLRQAVKTQNSLLSQSCLLCDMFVSTPPHRRICDVLFSLLNWLRLCRSQVCFELNLLLTTSDGVLHGNTFLSKFRFFSHQEFLLISVMSIIFFPNLLVLG